MENYTRRSFLKGIAVAGTSMAALTAFGCSSQETSEVSQAAANQGVFLPEKWDEEHDVVIVGAGGAGCAAAYGAAKEGADVLVIDSQGSNNFTSTAICGGYTYFVCSGLQEEQGIEDSIDLFVKDTMAYGESCKEDVLRVFAERSPDYYRLVTDELGLAWTGTVNLSPGCSVPRTLICDPAQHQQLIFKAAQDAGAAFMFDTTGSRLFVDGAGVVVGVLAGDSKGGELALRAKKAVVLATGGVTQSPEFLEECMPGASAIPAHSCAGHTALMHDAAMQVGCQLYGRPWIYATEAKYPGYTSMAQYAELYIYGAVEVNVEGERYIDESLYWCNERTRALLSQPTDPVDGICSWEIIDQTAYDAAVEAGPPIGLQDSTIELLVSADTFEELGEKIGAPALAATMARYNEDIARTGKDELFGRETVLGVGTDPVRPLDAPPFYAFKNAPHFDYDPATSFYVDTECRALNSFDEPVEGLYMVGEIMLRTVVGNHYQYGLATGAGGTLGLYCGQLVAGLESRE
ncbi:FAD-dependent oxidoreductase [Arabiibacter massiliensis]|uniref:FAD-dependent oxidoreductase n=1 Tax=Arabiibacter massiliensis TaxID=1870985 RepID=UPI0009BA8056|nr:FAD-dependent oxidoreductase [Arabiibacter massiliensis]